MNEPLKILLLAGTREARLLAARLKDDGRVRVTASLAGVTSAPAGLGVETRSGGFGGVEGLVDYLRAGKSPR
ncbi:precorrin-6A/cobalt-precorrin-6A reductase [Breoghania sp. L-A4]|uniref:precorrin-6A/cobalt-precorrin-6A reductase n=1 Tax=Breoghania sp. L-A4 TaxID=2304600 RepID=UPI0019677501|nr:precorrin-6A/cobalt-precorrin-6A reductase [Breoghania sp. L-A4]